MASKQCCLCGRESACMTVYKYWKQNERKFLEQHCDIQFLPESRICKRHRLEAGRHASDSTYIPIWKRKEEVRSIPWHTCVYSGCRVTSDTEKLIKAVATSGMPLSPFCLIS